MTAASSVSGLRLLVVVTGDDAMSAYARLIRNTGADCYFASSLDEIISVLTAASVHGVVLDMPTALRMKGPEKAEAMRLVQLYPLMRMRFSRQDEAITLLGAEQAAGTPDVADTLGRFIATQCAQFSPRPLRRADRKLLHYNVLMGPTPHPARAFRTSLANFSMGGCFVITATPAAVGQWFHLFFRKEDLGPHAPEGAAFLPVPCVTAHVTRWGERRAIPGMGAAFEVEDDALGEALRWLYEH